MQTEQKTDTWQQRLRAGWQKVYAYLPWWPVVGLWLLISALPYGWSTYQQVACIVLGVGYACYYIAYRRWRAITWSRTKWLYVLLIALYLMFPLRQLFDPTPPTAYYHLHMSRHVWLLYVGLAGLIGFSDRLHIKHIGYVMLLTSVAMAAYCAYLYWGTEAYAGMEPLVRFDRLRRTHIHSHMVMNLYINTALVLGFYCLSQTKMLRQRLLIGAGMLISWALILCSDGRIGLVTSIGIMGIGGVWWLVRLGQRRAALLSAVMIILVSLWAMQRPRISMEQVSRDPRLAIWDYSWRMVKLKPLFGYGLSSLSEVYVEQAYEDEVMYHGFVEKVIERQPEFMQQGRTMDTHHPHNAFLTYWLEVGIGGALLLLALLIGLALLPMGDYRVLLWLFVGALTLQCLTEPIGAHLLPQFIAIGVLVAGGGIDSR